MGRDPRRPMVRPAFRAQPPGWTRTEFVIFVVLTFVLLIGMGVSGVLTLVGVLGGDVLTRVVCGLVGLYFGVVGTYDVADKLVHGRGPHEDQGRFECTARSGPFWAGAASEHGSAGVGFGIGSTVDVLDVNDDDDGLIEIHR